MEESIYNVVQLASTRGGAKEISISISNNFCKIKPFMEESNIKMGGSNGDAIMKNV